jgi:beta-lactamase regulating signal transducer with metallopeptidase domain
VRRWPATATWAAVALTAPVALLAAIGWRADGASLWIVLHACARAGATAASLPVVLALAVGLSIWALWLWHASRQALVGRRILRAARWQAVTPAPAVLAASRRLGIRRLLVTELPERLAFCAGLLRPTVVVSAALVRSLEPAALEAVLAHEAAHARNRDPRRQVLAHAVARSLWIAPAARQAAEHQRLRLELAADRHATAQAGRRALAEALLALHAAPSPAGAPAIAGGDTALGARIDALALGSSPPRLVVERSIVRRSIAGLTLMGLLALAVAASPGAGSDPILPMPMNGPDSAEMALAWAMRAGAVALGWLAVRRWLMRGTTG